MKMYNKKRKSEDFPKKNQLSLDMNQNETTISV